MHVIRTPPPTIIPRQINSSAVISVVTSTLALTTLFTPDPACYSPIFSSSDGGQNYGGFNVDDQGTTEVYVFGSSCYPPGFYQDENTAPYFSPGACPSGFSVIEAITPVNPLRTVLTCCPS